MVRTEIIERLVVSQQLKNGLSARNILVSHYNELLHGRSASRGLIAKEIREARDAVSGARSQFFIDLAKTLRTSLVDIIQLFKDRGIVRLFDKAGWSFKGLWEMLKGGYKSYVMIQRVISEYIASTGVMKWSKENLEKLDKYLQEHPTTKRLGGVALGLLLFYLYIHMADTGDADFDFDISDIVDGLSGHFSLADIFGGPDGARLLVAFAIGSATGLTFPWPSANAIAFIVGIVRILAKKVRKKLNPSKKPVEQEAIGLGIA